MPLAKDIAAELRKFADALDTNPDAELAKPRMFFSHSYVNNAKDKFLAVAKLLPRPLKKGDGYSHNEVTLDYENETVNFYASIAKSEMCELVTPARAAVYRCVPILSAEEESTLEVQ